MGASAADGDSPWDPPVSVIAWECSGEVAPGAEWSGAKIEIREERVRFAEVILRFGSGGLPPDEAVWFERPTAAPLHGFVAWEQLCAEDCRDRIVQEIFPDRSNPIVERSTGGHRCRERISVALDGTRTSSAALEVVAMSFRSGRSGLIVNPVVAPDRVTCDDSEYSGRTPDTTWWIDERHNLESEAVEVHGDPSEPLTGEVATRLRASARELLTRLRESLGARKPDPGTLQVGPVAVRLAEHDLLDLANLCDAAVDDDEGRRAFPGTFSLLASVSSRGTVEALAAIEARFGRNEWDRAVALRLLGDGPAGRQREAFADALDRALTGDDTVAASLALRALLKADPAAARRRARALLDDDRLWRSAAGVFVLSDPALARRFAGIEVVPSSVRDEVREYVESVEGESEVPDR